MATRVLQDSISIPANSNTNVLAGKRFENLLNDSLLNVYQTGSAAGLRATLFAGNDSLMEEGAVSSANRIPQKDDLVLEGAPAYAGSKLQLTVANTTGGALTYFYRIEFDDNVMRV
jgi:hypothetical protein